MCRVSSSNTGPKVLFHVAKPRLGDGGARGQKVKRHFGDGSRVSLQTPKMSDYDLSAMYWARQRGEYVPPPPQMRIAMHIDQRSKLCDVVNAAVVTVVKSTADLLTDYSIFSMSKARRVVCLSWWG